MERAARSAEIHRPLATGRGAAAQIAAAGDETLAERHQQIIERINALKQQWLAQVGEVEAVLENSGLDRQV